ncbi:secreted RxLR effector protein 161-like [Neodiprion lecontei]|uniref:Secreted RxLR effector protein 161-like n=1 Tax=Neodiprion lecontei TaxID=441921 RepID=A0ABM3GQR9_NEOLC|nr:secreted RxLR effector protein 161-like [Neodiprion lecontei]
MVSKFNDNPGKTHWSTVKRTFRYLKGTSKMRLEFSAEEIGEVIGYCDADWASDIDERRSCIGYVFILQGGAISWNCKRQATVALSTTEAEYMALSSATQEAIWLK